MTHDDDAPTGGNADGTGDATDDVDPREAAAARREAETARREAETARRDREKAQRQAEREAEKARRDAEKARRQAEKDAERVAKEAQKVRRDTERVREQAEREARRIAEQAEKDARRARDQAEREARDAAKEAGRALREAEQAERAAALARQRAAREAEKARRQVQRADPDAAAPPDLDGLPRDVALLWRSRADGGHARRGPRPGLTLEQIADAGIALADTEGLDAVSMARLAESLGFTTMSLYRYVSSKDEVLMLMADRASGQPPRVGPEVGGWRARLELLLELMQPVLAAHPWMARTPTLLWAVGPHRLAWMEAMLAALDGTGVPEQDKLMAVGVLSGHQLDQARLVEADQQRRRQLAAAHEGVEPDPDAVIGRLVSPTDHPALSRAVAEGALEPPADDGSSLDFGTRVILDGIAALVARHSASPS